MGREVGFDHLDLTCREGHTLTGGIGFLRQIFVGCRIGDAMCAMWMGLFTSYVVLFQSRSASARLAQQDPGVAAEGDGATPAQNLGVICALAAMHCCTGFTDGMVMTQILDRFCTLVSRLLRLLVNGRRDEGYDPPFEPAPHRHGRIAPRRVAIALSPLSVAHSRSVVPRTDADISFPTRNPNPNNPDPQSRPQIQR